MADSADASSINPQAFGASFQGFLKQMAQQKPEEEPELLRLLREHFGDDPRQQPILREAFKPHEHPNLQRAIDSYLEGEGRSADLRGLALSQHRFMSVSLSGLLSTEGNPLMGDGPPKLGPVEYANVTLHDDQVITCVQLGIYLIRDGDARVVLLLHRGSAIGPFGGEIEIEAMAPTREAGLAFLAELRRAMREQNVYRGRVVSLGESQEHRGALAVKFHPLPEIARDGIILPEGVLERVERHTIAFSRHRERLRAAGRHLKRGLLLHGPPGTGKTMTAMYLVGCMPERTVLLLTGRGLKMLEESCALARLLQPATVILEDVDLIAKERGNDCNTPLLFELLNLMDGLSEDVDVIFVLTTNQPESLEPALAARPGRIDASIEVPLPDAECRRRLFELYGVGLVLELDDLDRFIERTEGVSAAFVRELLRKAALLSAEDGGEGEIVVRDRHLDDALQELVAGGKLSRSLLGFGLQVEASE